eukprot:scaffold65861_cov18-Tisochrysis_lutea.AAC.2
MQLSAQCRVKYYHTDDEGFAPPLELGEIKRKAFRALRHHSCTHLCHRGTDNSAALPCRRAANDPAACRQLECTAGLLMN